MAETITTPEQMREAAAKIAETHQVYQADVCAARIRAIPIAPQPVAVTVNPLVWEDPCNGNGWLHVARSVFGDYYVSIDGGRHSAWLEANLRPYENKIGDDVGSVWEAKALADADYDARTRALVHPADPLSDPRVVALVKAARWIGVCAQTTGGVAGPDNALMDAIDRLAAALRAIGGEA